MRVSRCPISRLNILCSQNVYKRTSVRISLDPFLERADMSNAPIFVDLQGFVVRDRFAAKEVAVLRSNKILTHHVFREPIPWSLLTRAEKSQACWLTANHHGLQWNDGDVDYRKAKTIVRRAVCDQIETPRTVYVKGLQKTKWLREILGDALENVDLSIETMDAEFDDIDRLEDLDATGAFRCDRHSRNCAMENVCKMRNWWIERERKLSDL